MQQATSEEEAVQQPFPIPAAVQHTLVNNHVGFGFRLAAHTSRIVYCWFVYKVCLWPTSSGLPYHSSTQTIFFSHFFSISLPQTKFSQTAVLTNILHRPLSLFFLLCLDLQQHTLSTKYEYTFSNLTAAITYRESPGSSSLDHCVLCTYLLPFKWLSFSKLHNLLFNRHNSSSILPSLVQVSYSCFLSLSLSFSPGVCLALTLGVLLWMVVWGLSWWRANKAASSQWSAIGQAKLYGDEWLQGLAREVHY